MLCRIFFKEHCVVTFVSRHYEVPVSEVKKSNNIAPGLGDSGFKSHVTCSVQLFIHEKRVKVKCKYFFFIGIDI